MKTEIKKVLLSPLEIGAKVSDLAARIADDVADKIYVDEEIVLIGILKGSYVFLSDLSRKLSDLGCPHCIDFMGVSSYADTKSTGNIKIECDLRHSIKDKHIIIVEDIIDTGKTLSKLINTLYSREPASIEVCTFLSKPTERVVDVNVNYIGYELNPPEFVVGYGLDYNEHFRDLPFIGVPTSQAIENYKKL